MASTVAEPVRPGSAPPETGRPRRGRTGWLVVGLLVLVAAGLSVRDRVEGSALRQPLEVVQRAASQSHQSVTVISPSTARRWVDGAAPAEQRVQEAVGPGNGFLEPAYYWFAGRHGGPGGSAPPEQARCYYLAAQHGAGLDAHRVSAIVQLCYLDDVRTPYQAGWTAVQ
jgi:hypothetical protein